MRSVVLRREVPLIRNNLLNILAKIRHLEYASQAPSVYTLNGL